MRITVALAACLAAVLMFSAPAAADSGQQGSAVESAAVNPLPWDQVFKWLAKKTNKPVISPYKLSDPVPMPLPTHPGYTLPEILDILNDALEDQGYLLCQRQRSFTLVPIDERPGGGGGRIQLEDLELLGDREIASVVIPLKVIIAKEAATRVKGMMNKYSEVVPLEVSNSLLLQDRVATLKRVRAVLEAADSEAINRGNMREHKK